MTQVALPVVDNTKPSASNPVDASWRRVVRSLENHFSRGIESEFGCPLSYDEIKLLLRIGNEPGSWEDA